MTGDLILGIVIVAIAILFYSQTLGIKPAPIGLSSADFPRLITVVLMILGGLLILQSLLKMKHVKSGEKKKKIVEKSTLWRFIVLFAMFVLYIIFVDDLGFILTTIPFLFVALSLFSLKNVKNLIQNVIISVAVTLAIYFVFYKIFQVMLPMFSL